MNPSKSAHAPGSVETTASPKRRTFLRASIGAPVLLTAAAKPVLGATTCASVSAMGSAGSQAERTASVCTGLTPEQWKRLAASWPTPYCGVADGYVRQEATRYHCPTTGFAGFMFGNLTMLEVIDIGERAPGIRGLGRYMVAAILNARSGRTPVLSETGVRDMWNDLINRGYYEPIAGVQWQAPEIIAYLNTTMG